ncbi:methyltransferase family protein [Paracoccus beibuensis]|uniref:methyltransferase family protein n=1 Tax=Paracoccus beibuensis TaxID=547602 RepID=UPI00223FA831|nr:methyltransferase [Paracoccus beibuensis]
MRVTPDYPPVWLLAFIGLAWGCGRLLPAGPPILQPIGWALTAAGLALALWAAALMLQSRTTVDPHGQPQALVTTGPFALSRNPIYLADLLILLGAALALGAWLAAPLLVWALARILAARFIRPEEARLAAAFPADFARYAARTRRWI